jgi:threonine aldolase
MKKIAGFARQHDIKMHLDGARLFLASAYTGVEPAAYAASFDTVYVSLYKYFNAGTGAVLAGPKKVIAQVEKARKVFGAGLFQGWPYAAVALHFLDGFAGRFKRAIDAADALFARLAADPRFQVQTVPGGTNIRKLLVPGVDPAKFRAALRDRGIFVGGPGRDFPGFALNTNETVCRRPADELAKMFVDALPPK